MHLLLSRDRCAEIVVVHGRACACVPLGVRVRMLRAACAAGRAGGGRAGGGRGV
jgi:hypothetical protein